MLALNTYQDRRVVLMYIWQFNLKVTHLLLCLFGNRKCDIIVWQLSRLQGKCYMRPLAQITNPKNIMYIVPG